MARPNSRFAGWNRWLLHEPLSAGGILACAASIGVKAPQPGSLPFEMLLVGLAWTSVVVGLAKDRGRRGERARVVATGAMILWGYWVVQRVVTAWPRNLWDGALRAADEGLLGSMPATWFARGVPAWLVDLTSVGYLLYLVYLGWAVGEACVSPGAHSRCLLRRLGSAYVVGLTGYILVPAVGPLRAYPELFAMMQSGPLGHAIARFVAWGSSVYDAFPSLHVLVTLAIVDYDRRWNRRRLRIMAVPLVGIVGSTLLLGYHYAVDLLAAVGLVALLVASGWWSGGRAADDAAN